MPETGVRVVGLDEFARDLRRFSPDAARELAREYRSIARLIREKSRSRARARSASYSKAATGIQSRASSKDARIRINPKRYPWIFGEEFGAYQNIERRIRYGSETRTVTGWNQFPPWRGNQWTQGIGPASGAGYAVYPTIRQETPRLVDAVEDAMDKALSHAFPEKR